MTPRDAELERLRAENAVMRGGLDGILSQKGGGWNKYVQRHKETARQALSQTRPSELLAAVEETIEALEFFSRFTIKSGWTGTLSPGTPFERGTHYEGEPENPALAALTRIQKALHGEARE